MSAKISTRVSAKMKTNVMINGEKRYRYLTPIEEDITDDMSFISITRFLLKHGDLAPTLFMHGKDKIPWFDDDFINRAREIMTHIWLTATGCDLMDNSMQGGDDRWYVLFLEKEYVGEFSTGTRWTMNATKRYVLRKILQRETPSTLKILVGDTIDESSTEISFWDIVTNRDSYMKYTSYWCEQ